MRLTKLALLIVIVGVVLVSISSLPMPMIVKYLMSFGVGYFMYDAVKIIGKKC